MGLAYIKSTGTRSSGESTADDWSDANCYPLASFSTALDAVEGSSPAEVVLNDEEFTCNAISLNDNAGTYPLTISSRSGSTTLVPNDGTTRMFQNTSVTNEAAVTFKDLTFDGNATEMTFNDTLVLFSQSSGDITFEGVTWQNWTFSGATAVSPLFRQACNTTPRYAYLKNCTITGITHSTTENDGLIEAEVFSGQNHSLVIDGLTVSNTSLTASTGLSWGLIAHASTGECTISNLRVSNFTSTANGTSQTAGGIVRQVSAAGTLSVKGFTGTDITLATSTSSSTDGLFKFTTTGTIEDCVVENLRRTGRESGSGGNSIGGLFTSAAGGNVTSTNTEVRNSGGFYGLGGYATGGGACTINNGRVLNCDDNAQLSLGGANLNGLAYYGGGDGDFTLNDCTVYGITQQNTPGTEQGLAIYSHHVDRTSDTTKATTINNVTVGGVATDADTFAVRLSIDYATATHNATITGLYVDDANYSLKGTDTNGTLNITMDKCHFQGGTSSIDTSTVSGTVTNTNMTEGGPPLTIEGLVSSSSPGALIAGDLRDQEVLFFKRRHALAGMR